MNSSGNPGIAGYEDIHENLRFWFDRLVALAGTEPLVLYDIGANDGELTIPFCRHPHRVYAFEPLPRARRRLLDRAEGEASRDSLTVIPCALGEREDRAAMEVYSDDTFSSLHTRPREDLAQYDLHVAERIEVRVLPLDVFTGDGAAGTGLVAGPLPAPDIVKIDVEGAERSVLLGAAETLMRHGPAILVEYSCVNTKNAGYPREEILRILHSFGYRRVFGLYRNRDRSLYTGSALESCRIWNVLALSPRYMSALEGTDIHDTLPAEPDAYS